MVSVCEKGYLVRDDRRMVSGSPAHVVCMLKRAPVARRQDVQWHAVASRGREESGRVVLNVCVLQKHCAVSWMLSGGSMVAGLEMRAGCRVWEVEEQGKEIREVVARIISEWSSPPPFERQPDTVITGMHSAGRPSATWA